MRTLRIAILLLLLDPLSGVAATAGAPLSLPQYIAALQQLRQDVLSVKDAPATSALAGNLPEEWRVTIDGRPYTLSTHALGQGLVEYANQHTTANRDALTAQLDLLLADAHAMQSPSPDFTAESTRLQEILSRHEFRNVRGETWWDRWKREAQQWLWQLMSRFLLSSAFPTISRIAIWALLALAIAVAAWWIVRTYQQKNIYTQFSGAPEIVSAKPWRDWEAEAKAAAQEGRWRDAVHLLYWAGISFLEGQGLWQPDLARTPREYLRLLPADDAHRDPLQQLTRSFEQVWYGNDVATADTFAGASALLEKMGCR